MIEYKVIDVSHPKDLEEQLNESAKEGWEIKNLAVGCSPGNNRYYGMTMYVVILARLVFEPSKPVLPSDFPF